MDDELNTFLNYIDETVLNPRGYRINYNGVKSGATTMVKVQYCNNLVICVTVKYSNNFLNDLYQSLSTRHKMIKTLNSLSISPCFFSDDHTERMFHDLMPILESVKSAKSVDELKMLMAIAGI